jgi:glyoxylase-like metal-dependent hydrolase (beta-lactamase superfamily II)
MNTTRTILGAVLSLTVAACSSDAASIAGGGDAGADSGVGARAAADSSVPPVDSGVDAPAADSATDAGSFTVETYSSSATGTVDIQVNSHLVLGPTEALLVDSQFLVADAQAVADMITKSGRRLTTVLVTHAHPDHYAGLAVIQAAFPSAAIVTTPGVLEDYQANAPGTLTYLQSVFGSLVASKLVTPAPLTTGSITLDGTALQIVEMPNAGESAHAAALALPGGVLLSGDLLYNHVHLQLGECHSQGWRDNLTLVKAMGFTTFYPGHGQAPAGASVFSDDTSYIDGTIPILRAAEATDAGAGDAGDPRVGAAVTQIVAMFPAYESQFLVGYSTSAFLDTNKCP